MQTFTNRKYALNVARELRNYQNMQTFTNRKYALNVARELRNYQTREEKYLWDVLRRRQILGYRFLRQYPILYEWQGVERFFIADFYCHELKLIIEVDGSVHDKQKEYDVLRDDLLSAMKYKTLRFSNEQVNDNIDNVIVELLDYVKKTVYILAQKLKSINTLAPSL